MSGNAVEPARAGPMRAYPDMIEEGERRRPQPDHHDVTPPATAADGGGREGGISSGGAPAGLGSSNVSTTQKMASASWGSLLTSILVTPLDVVRVRLQSQSPVMPLPASPGPSSHFKELPPNLGVTACCREVFWVGNNAQFCMAGGSQTMPGGGGGGMSNSANGLASDCLVEQTQQKNFTSTLDGLRKIARNEGPLSLWRGLSPTLVMAVPANVIYFTGYDWLRFDRASPIAQVVHDNWAPLVAGSVARISAASVISPIEMFRTRLQATSGTGADHFKATLRGLHQMTQRQGYGSLWRGLTLTMWRDVPFSGLYWWGYEAVRNGLAELRGPDTATATAADQLSHRHRDNAITFVNSFTAGAVSGAASAFITTPFDVGKTRQQVFRHASEDVASTQASTLSSSSSSHSSPSPLSSSSSSNMKPEQLSIPRFLLHIWREEGLYGLFRGWAARCLKVAPACAIMISSYEVGKSMAGHANERRETARLESQGDEG